MTGVTYEEACTQAAIPGEWQSNWAALAAANILQRIIFTIYPPLPGCHAGGSYNNCNQVFIPSSSTLSELIGDDIYTLWSSVLFDVKNISQTKPWRANHFVPLIRRTKLESCCVKEKKMIKRKKKVLNKENSYHVFSVNAAEKDGSCSSDRSLQTDMCKTQSNVIVLSDSEQSIAILNGTSRFRLEWPELGSSSSIVPFDDDEILADCHSTPLNSKLMDSSVELPALNSRRNRVLSKCKVWNGNASSPDDPTQSPNVNATSPDDLKQSPNGNAASRVDAQQSPNVSVTSPDNLQLLPSGNVGLSSDPKQLQNGNAGSHVSQNQSPNGSTGSPDGT